MKKLIATSILSLILACELKAQTNITLPAFSESSIILFVNNSVPGQHELTFFDGGTVLPVIKIPIEKGQTGLVTLYPQLGYIINELKKKGYKFIDTEFTNTNNSIYYFQKD